MDVLCVGMYRACSTWQYEVAAHLVETHREGVRLGYLTGEEYESHVRSGGRDAGWGVLKSHEEHRSLAKALRERTAVGLYAHRDLRDVIFSLMHKRGLSFETLLRQGMIHQILANDRFWSGRPGVLVQRYDRLIADPVTGVQELASHLGLRLAPGEAAHVADEYSFEANRKRAEELGRQLRGTGADLTDPSGAQLYDPKTLLHWNHLRKGSVGDWRTRATARQLDTIRRIGGTWLVTHGYECMTSSTSVSWVPKPMDRVRQAFEIARGGVACRLRCLSLRHPELARVVKRMLGITNVDAGARKADLGTDLRADAAATTRGPAESHSVKIP